MPRITNDSPMLDTLLTRFASELSGAGHLAHGTQLERSDSLQSVINYLDRKGSRHKNYRYYGSRERIDGIIGDSCFYLTDGSNWNDTYDRARFNPENSGSKQFGTCFSAATSESIAMWMLYGGIEGNGAMINFDKNTLATARSNDTYEFGYFDANDFKAIKSVDASDIRFFLTDVLYFSNADRSGELTIGRVGDSRKTRIPSRALAGISHVAKHEAWSYEAEVRFVACVDKRALGDREAEITAVRVPFSYGESFVSERVFDSPMAEPPGSYRDSLLRGTVEWDLCGGCDAGKSS